MKRLLILFAVALAFVSCKKDGPIGKITFQPDVVVLDDYGKSVTVDFTVSNIASVRIVESGLPGGWQATPDFAGRTLLVTAPERPETQEDEYETEIGGTITLTGTDTRGHTVSGALRVTIGERIDLTGEPSNCYIVGKANALYSFDATRSGNSGTEIAPAEVKLLWIDKPRVIRHASFEEGVMTFFVSEDEQTDEFVESNALFAAYDKRGNVLATWHIWITEYDPSTDFQTSATGEVFMTRNLGAGGNTNASEDEIQASYGLYYQWGRPTPFPTPIAYNCASGVDHPLYDIRSYMDIEVVEYIPSSAKTGTVEYALAHPMHYILGTEASSYDWLYAAGNDALWGDTKTEYDPCPRGWKVPGKEAFAAFTIADDHSTAATDGLRMAYGWTLTDGSLTDRFHASGLRSELLGRLHNLNTNENPQPWIGCYWTSGTAASRVMPTSRPATALYFSLDTDDASQSVLDPSAARPRAAGFNIRCVKE